MSKKYLLTSALPYANGPLHFGHIAGAYLPADCFARFQRMQGEDVLFICGSDEHGVPITLSAEAKGRTYQEHVDINHLIIKAFFEKLEISFDHYSRTTWPGHVEAVQQYFLDLLENGHIEERDSEQLYSEKEERFLADRYVMGTCPKCKFPEARGDECQKCGASYEATDLINPVSKITGSALIKKTTRHWFLRFDHFKEQLLEWIETKDWKPNVVNFAKGYIKELKPRAITRDSNWGVPIPLEGTEGKVFYVWFDAPIGYISATKEWAELKKKPNAWKDYWEDPETELVHFIGKDNIPFHAVFFPAMTMGQNAPYKLVDELPANEFLNLEGRQFSKSDNWTIDTTRFFTEFTPDQIRYYLASHAPETQDAEFTWRGFQSSCNAELLGKFGNFANRTLVFASKHCEGQIPSKHLEQDDADFLDKIQTLSYEIEKAYQHFQLRKASALIMELATLGNVYFDEKKPWKLAKDPQMQRAMHTTIACCLDCLKALCINAAPIIPEATQKLWAMLGKTETLSQINWSEQMSESLEPKTPLPTPSPLFKKVEDEVVEKEESLLKENLPEEAPSSIPALKDEIEFPTFAGIDLRIGEILEVEAVPKSKKLLKFLVDIGLEKRTIVSGISPFFEDPQTLIGKKVVVVANLKPAKLMGIESQGMIIMANVIDKENGVDTVEMPGFTKASPGDQVF